MNYENQHLPTLHPSTTEHRILDYPLLIDSVQISVARKLNVAGSLETESFDLLLSQRDEREQNELINEVGRHFDDALVDFVVGTLIGQREHHATILVSESEGFDGYLPWEPKLQERIKLLQESGALPDTEVTVRRYSPARMALESLASHVHTAHSLESSQKHAA